MNTGIASIDAIRLFPTVAWKSQISLPVYEPMNKSVIAQLEAIMAELPGLSPGQSWQSSYTLHKLPEFGALVECINTAARHVLDFLRIGYRAFEITACWANVNAPGAAHPMHNHPNNFLSGVYYAQTQQGADTINFHDPRIQTGIIRPPVTELTSENTDQVVVRVSTGTLLIFPSWLQHSVDPNRSAERRISISFNIMFSSYAENLSRPLWSPGMATPGHASNWRD